MEENQELQEIKTIIIDNVKYKTRLTKKYQARKPYEPVNFGNVLAFIPGTILNIFVKEGQKVQKGSQLLELEAMKMTNILRAPFDGTIQKIYVKKGDMVSKNHILVGIA